MRLKGEPGEVVIANFAFGKPVQIERYNNEDYIREFEERKRNYELQRQQKTVVSEPINTNSV